MEVFNKKKELYCTDTMFVREAALGGYRCAQIFVGRTSQFTKACLLYTSPSPRDGATSRMPSSA